MYVHGIRRLFAFEGYVVQKITMSGDLVQVHLRRDGRYGLACPGCGGRMHVHRRLIQTARDLPLGTALHVLLTYPAIQGRCTLCGGFSTIRPPGIDDHARATRRLMEFVSRLARHLPLAHIPEVVGIDDATAFRWDKAILQDKLPPPNRDGLRILRDVIKGQRYNLFRHPAHRTPAQTQSLMNLLHMNRNLCVCYILKEGLGQLWEYSYPKAAAKYLAKWVRWAAVSGVQALRDFGRKLLKAKDEILNFCKHSITIGPLEGFNNTVSRIIHRACGVTNLDYLFLKLRQESLEPVPPK